MNAGARLLGWLLAAALAASAAAARAEPYRWANVAIGGGGFVTAVIPSLTQRNLFYARTDVGGAYRWDHAQARWVAMLDGLSEQDVGLYSVDALALDPKDSAVVYLLAGVPYFSNGKTVVMRSTDRGATFGRVTDMTAQFRANGNGMGRSNGEKMQVDPGNSDVLYVGSRNNGLFKSTDAGASFTRVASLPVTTTPNQTGISFVLLDPTSVVRGAAQRLFVGVSRYGSVGPNLYRSDDAGATFKPVPNAPAGFLPQRAVLASDGHLFITYGNGAGPHGDSKKLNPPEPMDAGQVWKHHVASGAWHNVSPAGMTRAFSGVSVDPKNPRRVIVSTVNTWLPQREGGSFGDHFFLTADGGATWKNVVAGGFKLDTAGVSWMSTGSIHWAGSIEFDPFDSKAVWVTSGNGIFRTGDVAAAAPSWTFTVKGLEEVVPQVVVSVPGGPLLSSILDYDGFRHTDVDAYAPIHTPHAGSTTGLAVAPANTAIAVRVGKKMYRSADTGTRWTEVAGTKGPEGKVALSADGASLLHTVRVGEGAHATYRSVDFASPTPTWTPVKGLAGRPLRPVADPVNAARFYAYDDADGAVRISTDGGASFKPAASLARGGSTLLRTAPGREGDVWVALRQGGLVRSTNAGGSFSAVAKVTYCGAVGFGKPMAGAAYPTVFIWGEVAGGKRGVYRSTDAGASWLRINNDAQQYGGPGNGEFVTGDMNTEGVVYMGTVGRGLVYGAPVAR